MKAFTNFAICSYEKEISELECIGRLILVVINSTERLIDQKLGRQ